MSHMGLWGEVVVGKAALEEGEWT